MTTNTTRQSPRQVVRAWPAWEINERLRRQGLNHLIIAQRARTSESTVSHTIRRRRTVGEAVERVWAQLEDALTTRKGKAMKALMIAALLAFAPISVDAQPGQHGRKDNPGQGFTQSTQHANPNAYQYHGVAAVPEPGTLILVGTGLVGVALAGRRYFKR